MVFTTSMIGYPHSRMSWLVKYKQATDYDAKKRIALYGNQTIYLVQFHCEEYDANGFKSLSPTELASSTESANFISYGKDRNDEPIEADSAHELWETTSGLKTSLATTTANYLTSSNSSEPSHQIVFNAATFEVEYYDENEEISTTMRSTPDTSLVNHYSTHPVYLVNFGISVNKTKYEDYKDSTPKSHDDILTTTSFYTAKTWTDKPKLQMKKFDYFYVVLLIAGPLAGAFIVFTVFTYCVVRRRRSESTTEHFSPEVQTSDIK